MFVYPAVLVGILVTTHHLLHVQLLDHETLSLTTLPLVPVVLHVDNPPQVQETPGPCHVAQPLQGVPVPAMESGVPDTVHLLDVLVGGLVGPDQVGVVAQHVGHEGPEAEGDQQQEHRQEVPLPGQHVPRVDQYVAAETGQPHQEPVERLVVPLADAGVQPDAVVVQHLHTVVAQPTVHTPRRTVHETRLAELHTLKLVVPRHQSGLELVAAARQVQ